MTRRTPATGPHPIRCLSGPRACEGWLLARVATHRAAVRSDPAALAAPLRIVVPSRSLREHVASRVSEQLGATAGVVVQTLFHLAHEVLRRADCSAPGAAGRLLLPVLVRRVASRESTLRRVLEPLQDGYGAVAGAVSDLLDAGFEPALLPALEEALVAGAEARDASPQREASAVAQRAVAVARVAARVCEELEERGHAPPPALFVRARELLEAEPDRLPAAGLLVHGYADATGVQSDLLEALVRLRGAEVLMDLPPDPVASADPARPAPGQAFAARLRARLGWAGELAPPADPPQPARVRLAHAPGAHAEVRAVADRLFAAVHREGVRPERVAVVARDLESYRVPLRVQLRRLALPFSGGRGSLGPEGRRVRALLELLEGRGRARVERWLDAWEGPARLDLADLRLALHALGLGRLGDVAERLEGLVGDASRYALPVRRGIARGEADATAADEAEPGGYARRRQVSRRLLASAWERAAAVKARLERLAEPETLGASLAELRRLLHVELGWTPRTPGARQVAAALAELEAELGSALRLEGDELRILVGRALEGIGHPPLGGAGGGVQLLSVTEARGRTFERLFVLGLNRGAFPRPVREDPLLPDALRRAALAVLPDLPVKERGFDEERYLFAQLLAAAPEVTLTWQHTSEEGRERPASPLVERLRLAGALGAERLPALLDERAGDVPRPAVEHAPREALATGPTGLREPLALALAQGPAGSRAPAAARARVAALAELEAPPGPRPRLGPWLGRVGPVREPADPRRMPTHVTRLEDLWWCPWRTFLGRVLRLEPAPDALATLPDVDGIMLGQVAHAVLEQVVVRAGLPTGVTLEELADAVPAAVPWPDEAEVEALLHEASRQVMREQGIATPGFAHLLAGRARPVVERIRDVEWGEARRLPGVLGAEVRGRVQLGTSPPRELHFRADRADRASDGAFVLVDYKAGRPLSRARKETTRREHLQQQLAQGKRLQVAAYARAGGAGRYVFGHPESDPASARFHVADGHAEAMDALDASADALFAAWEAGAFPPRLVHSDLRGSGPACDFCELAEACVRGDTASRRRLVAWLGAEGPPADALEAAARRMVQQGGWTR